MGQKEAHPKSKKENRKIGVLLFGFGFVLLLIGMFIDSPKSHRSVSSTQIRSPEMGRVLNQINKHLKEADIKSELDRREIERESQRAGTTDSYEDGVLSNSTRPVTLEQERTGQQVFDDTDGSRKDLRPTTPDQRISAKIQRDLWLREDAELREREYIHQFLENARKGGLNIKLNSNLDVTGIQQRRMEMPVRIPQSDGGASK